MLPSGFKFSLYFKEAQSRNYRFNISKMVYARKSTREPICERKTLGPTSRKIDKDVYIHTYIYIYTHIYTYIHIYIHTHAYTHIH